MNKVLLLVLVIVAGGVFGWFYFNGDFRASRPIVKTTPTPTDVAFVDSDGSTPVITDESLGEGDTKGGVGSQFVFTYSETGFVPKEITVKKGDTVSFVNKSTGALWVASAMHPTHLVLPGFDQKKSVANGGIYSYTFEKVGTWKFHNHMSSSMTGTVIVK